VENDSFTFALTNLRSLNNKISHLKFYLKKANPFVVFICESWLNQTADNFFPGYTCHQTNRGTKGGGVMIMVSNKAKKVEKIKSSWPESCSVSFTYKNVRMGVYCVYRSPNAKVGVDAIIEDIRSITSKFAEVIICGDVNAKIVNGQSAQHSKLQFGRCLLETALELGLEEQVKGPTCFSGKWQSQTEIILTRPTTSAKQVIKDPPIGKSDHCVIRMKYAVHTNRGEIGDHRVKNLRRVNVGSSLDFSRTDWTKVRDELMNVMSKEGSAIENWLTNAQKMKEIARKHTPRTEKSSSSIYGEWYTEELLEKRNLKVSLWNLVRCSSGEVHEVFFTAYRKARDEYVKACSIARAEHECGLLHKAKDSGSMKPVFEYINRNCGRERVEENPKDIFPDQSEQETADNFADHFASVFTAGQLWIGKGQSGHTGLDSIDFSPDRIRQVIGKLNNEKANGPDAVANRSLKEMPEEMLEQLSA